MRVFDILLPLITLTVRAGATPPPSLHSDPNSYELSYVDAAPPSYSDIPRSPPPVYQPPPSYEHHRGDPIYQPQSGHRNRPPSQPTSHMGNGTAVLELGDYNRRFGQCVCAVIGLAMVGVIAGVTANNKHSRGFTDNHMDQKCNCPKVNTNDAPLKGTTRGGRDAARMSYRRRIRNWTDE
ncbi:uncharacterized protein C8R40DRAFT_1241942 [Lentinula edodes]|uniref:uncharacterized protein n=1 Tax=Lentinula edodes TaxID=5353 RepID=UPI001E8EC8BE|nr:uncharacterized protein C8R40DRAFT_1241942 [Lentinula edodes]KAH7867889.1 hypothetical protein C8R40DRAFT_1241942 [Lentinula edodes]